MSHSPRVGINKDWASSSLDDEDIVKVLDRVRSGDRPPQHCLEVAQRLLLKKHDQLKRETMLLIEAVASKSTPDSSSINALARNVTEKGEIPQKSTATILVTKAKLPLLVKIK